MTHPKLESLLDTINRVIVGKEDQVRLLLTAMLARGHVLLEDLPGMGKTVLAKTLAQAIGGTYNRVQFTADLLPSDVVGLHVFNPAPMNLSCAADPFLPMCFWRTKSTGRRPVHNPVCWNAWKSVK